MVCGIDDIAAELWQQRCSLCLSTQGVCICCSQPGKLQQTSEKTESFLNFFFLCFGCCDAGCSTVAHVMCARVRGLTVDVLLTRDGYKKVFYCRKHSMILKVRFVLITMNLFLISFFHVYLN